MYDDLAARGGNPIMWKTGHSLIKAKMKETHAELAGEMSGHMFFADRYYGFDDALYAACRLMEIVANSGHPLSYQLADLAEDRHDARDPLRLSGRVEIRRGPARRRSAQSAGIRPLMWMASASFSRMVGVWCALRIRNPCW